MQAQAVVFTAAQAAQGKTAYAQNCESCHGANLDDGQFGPPLKGQAFNRQWGGKPADAVFTYMSTRMPPGNAGSLGNPAYAGILAYVVQANGGQAGTLELPTDTKLLAAMLMPGTAARPGPAGPGGGLSPFATLPPAPSTKNPLDRFTPVTDAMLQNPPAGDWLTWRRTYDDQGFSPLKEIDRSNVANLRVAWTWSLPNGPNEATPLVHDGVIFVHSYNDKVQALDAVTGDLLWQYSRQLPQGVRVSVKKAMALHGDWLILGTSDMHVVALQAKTGEVVWDQAIQDSKETGWQLTGGPLIAKSKVIVGTGGQTARRKLDRGPGSSDGQGSLALSLHCAAGRARRQQLEWACRRQAQRGLGVDSRQLRSCAEPGLLRTRADLRYRSDAASR